MKQKLGKGIQIAFGFVGKSMQTWQIFHISILGGLDKHDKSKLLLFKLAS